jgi:hypothetical protein
MHWTYAFIGKFWLFFIIIEPPENSLATLRQTPRDPNLGRDLSLGTTALQPLTDTMARCYSN